MAGNSLNDKSKAKLIAKVFLHAHKGKWYTAKDLAEFINNNKLGVKGGISPTGLSKLLDDTIRTSNIERRRKNHKNVWEYCVVD